MRLLEATAQNLNEHRPIGPTSSDKVYANDSGFWKYKVYADTRGEVPLGGGLK